MKAFKEIRISRISPHDWDYLIEIVDDGGETMRMTAGIEDLDRISLAVDEKLDEMVEAAERLAMTG